MMVFFNVFGISRTRRTSSFKSCILLYEGMEETAIFGIYTRKNSVDGVWTVWKVCIRRCVECVSKVC